MKQDLLAPPKLSTRSYAKIVGAVSILMLLGGITLAVLDVFTIRELAGRAALVIALAVGAIWLYSRLMRLALRVRPERLPLIHAVIGVLMMVGALAQIVLIAPGASRFMPWWQIPVMFGFTLAQGGWGRRVGESLHCPNCEYECRFDDPADTPTRCSECGTPWLGRMKKGRRVRSPATIAAGIALALVGFIVLSPIVYMRTLGSHLPTPLLYSVLYLCPGGAYGGWTEMANRPLDPRWTAALAARVLDHRTDNQYDNAPSQWLEPMITAGKVPPDLADRFYREAFQAQLLVPKRVKAGEPFAARLRVTSACDGKSVLGLMFAGYSIGDEPARHGRADKTTWAFTLRPGVFQHYTDVLPQTLTAGHPGIVQVHALYWVVLQPSFRDELKWQADGTPAKPSAALWFERIELEQTVQVE